MTTTLTPNVGALKQRDTLRLCTAGSVDDGKSTFVGRLLHDTKSVLADQLASVERTSAESLSYPGDAAKLLQRFRHAVEFVAKCHDCTVDPVFDLPRILRVPDTLNVKDVEHPVPTFCEADTGTPLTVEQAMGVVQVRDGVDEAWKGRGVVYFTRLSAERTKTKMNRIVGTPEYRLMTIRNWATTTKMLAILDGMR